MEWNERLNVGRGRKGKKSIEVLHGLIQSAGESVKERGEGGREGGD
jgi:hypothetical protein